MIKMVPMTEPKLIQCLMLGPHAKCVKRAQQRLACFEMNSTIAVESFEAPQMVADAWLGNERDG